MSTQDIVQKLWNLCNVLRDDGITYHQYVTELTYILFLKMADETGADKDIPEAYRWGSLTSRSGIDLKKHYYTLLSKLGEESVGRVAQIYANASSSIEEPKNLEKIITEIDKLDWYEAKEEGLGDLYEGLLEKNANEKKSGAGQYFTPRVLIDVMTELIKPQLGDKCFDPACGTFGFMIAANRYVNAHNDMYALSDRQANFQQNKAFNGVELVHETHRLALMNAYLHNMNANITLGDSLAQSAKGLKDFDVILTNPPFGSQIVGTQAVMNVLVGERYKMVTKESKGMLRGEYGKLPGEVTEEVRKKCIGDDKVITCRPADLIEPELEKYRAEIGDRAKSEEDVLSYALFPAVATKFFEWRDNPHKDEAPAAEAAPAAKSAAPANNGPKTLYVEDLTNGNF